MTDWTRITLSRDWMINTDGALILQWIRENRVGDEFWDFRPGAGPGFCGLMLFQNPEDAVSFVLRFGCTA